MALVAGEDANLRRVADAGRDFAGEHGGYEFVAAGLAQDEGRSRDELAATRKKDDVLEEAQRAGSAAILIVDFTIDVIRVRQINQFCARLEEAIIPAVHAHARGYARRVLGIVLVQIEQHKLAGIEPEALVAQRIVDRAAERHKLRFVARKLRKRAHGEEHFFEQAATDVSLREAGGNIEPAD